MTKDEKALDSNDPKRLREINRMKCLMGESRFNEVSNVRHNRSDDNVDLLLESGKNGANSM